MGEEEIRKLGMKQISALIDQLKLERKMITDALIEKHLGQKSGPEYHPDRSGTLWFLVPAFLRRNGNGLP